MISFSEESLRIGNGMGEAIFALPHDDQSPSRPLLSSSKNVFAQSTAILPSSMAKLNKCPCVDALHHRIPQKKFMHPRKD